MAAMTVPSKSTVLAKNEDALLPNPSAARVLRAGGRKPGPLVGIAEMTGVSKSLVLNCRDRLADRNVIVGQDVPARSTGQYNIIEIAALILTVKLVADSGFAPEHAAEIVAAVFSAQANFREVFITDDIARFQRVFNAQMVKRGAHDLETITTEQVPDFFLHINFREFMWCAAVMTNVFRAAGYDHTDIEATELARSRLESANAMLEEMGKPPDFPKGSQPRPVYSKVVVHYTKRRLQSMPECYRCAVLVERKDKPNTLFGASPTRDFSELLRYSAPGEAFTTFSIVELLTWANAIYWRNTPQPVEA